jgi:heme exporter protein B
VSFVSLAVSNLRKDLRLEWRSRDTLNALGFFALLVVVIFSFSFDPNAEESRRIAGGIFWVSFVFAALVALNQAWARELRNQVLDAYRISPASPAALFLGKAVGNFLFVAFIEALVSPLFVIFYNLRAVGSLWTLAMVFLLGTWALVVNGTPSPSRRCSPWWKRPPRCSPVKVRRACGSSCSPGTTSFSLLPACCCSSLY